MTQGTTITVLLAEDHGIVRQGLHALLESSGLFRIVGEAKDGREAVELALTLWPDVTLMDISMPVLDGLAATRQILAAHPAARILILSAHSDGEYCNRARLAGAAGFLAKLVSTEIVIKAICEIAGNRSYFHPTGTRRLPLSHDRLRNRQGMLNGRALQLSSREGHVLQLVAGGEANKQIATSLGISIKTVEKHRQRVMDKLNIHDVAGLTRYAISAGVIEGARTAGDLLLAGEQPAAAVPRGEITPAQSRQDITARGRTSRSRMPTIGPGAYVPPPAVATGNCPARRAECQPATDGAR